jgi:hypothetical protein
MSDGDVFFHMIGATNGMNTAPIRDPFLSARDENSETKTHQIRISTALGTTYISQCYFFGSPTLIGSFQSIKQIIKIVVTLENILKISR